MPGIGVRPAATSFIAETLGRTSDTGVHWASYAGLTPVTRQSESSIRGEYTSHSGNKRLTRAMSLSAALTATARSPRESARAGPSSFWNAAASSPCTP